MATTTTARGQQGGPPATRGKPPTDPGNTLALVESGKWLQFLGSYEADFTRVLPAHVPPEAFIGMAAAYVRRDRSLQAAVEANPGSLVLALRECAALGHLPMAGTFALVPYNNKNAPGGKQVVGIEQYQGVIERMFRSGGVASVHVEVVRESDRARWRPTEMQLPYHDLDEFADDLERGPLKAVYAFARLHTGGISQVAWLAKGQVLKHRAVSRSGDSFWGPAWPNEGPWTQDMWKKTALHVLEKFVPTSAAYRWEVARSEAAAGTVVPGVPDRSPRAAAFGPGIQDAELVDESGPRDGPPPVESPAAVDKPVPGPVAEQAEPAQVQTEQTPEPTLDGQAEGGTGWPKVRQPPKGQS